MPANLLDLARSAGHPVIQGNRVTFLWQGAQAPRLIWDLDDWEEHPQVLEPAGGNLWVFSRELPRGAYVEYAFLDPEAGTRVRDPLNPRRLWNGVGNYNHYFYMSGGGPHPATLLRRGVPRGQVARHEIQITWTGLPGRRAVWLYRPAQAGGRLPLLVVYDGRDYLQRGRIATVLDNLIAERRIPPLAMALVENGGRARMPEYACSDATLGLLLYQLLPLASKHLPLLDWRKNPGVHGVLGASMGGLMALYTGLRLPQVFGHIFSQSGAFFLGDGEEAGPPFGTAVVDLARLRPRPAVRIYMDVGRFEWLLPANRRMRRLLREQGFALTYREYAGAHNYTSWRDDLARGLIALFG